ncbi:MAG: tetratricopeptide repeat protein [Chitinophagaceae bacterium]|nr:tetratricopeptide repeat protein [Chitinophagaceae bacterium]
MRKYLLFYFALIIVQVSSAQALVGRTEEGRGLYGNARDYLQKGDYSNAIMVFNQAVQVEPDNLVFRRDLAFAYYLQGDMLRGEHMIAPLLKVDSADEETFKIACVIYSSMKKMEEAKEAINKGISKYPKAGILYAEKGELYTRQKKYKDASAAWEKGIENAPAYHMNYYNLSKVYFFTKDYLWAIIYGETFVNMESFSSKTEEVKKIVFESYKFLIAELNNVALDGKQNRYENPTNFKSASMKIFDNLRNVVTGGINVENLSMLRARFLLDWNRQFALKYPFELFDYQHKMIQQGFYECYNQWLFGKLDHAGIFKQWTQKHASKMNEFDVYFRSHKLVPQEHQYYQTN